MSYTFLRFRTLEQFIDYLKSLQVHRYGLVIFPEISHSSFVDGGGKKIGVSGITLSWRLTAKDDTEKEILVLDIPYYHDAYITIDHARQESADSEKRLLASIEKLFAEKSKDYSFTRLEAEFKVSAL